MSLLRHIRHGLRALVDARSADRDAEDEVRHYLDEAASARERAGMSAADARRAATIEMGNPTATREQLRSMGWEHRVEEMTGDVRYAVRRLRRSMGFAAAAVVTLALGVGASTAVFSAISPVLLEPLPFPHANRLVTIDDRTDAGAPMPVTLGTYAEVSARSHSLEAVAAADNWQPSISGFGDPERLVGQRVTAGYFGVYGVRSAIGRVFTREDERPGGPRVVIVSDGLLQRRFGGNRAIVGHTIDLDGDPYTVVGVMPPRFANVIAPATEIWAPLHDEVTGDLNSRSWGHHYKMIGRLAPGSTIMAAAHEMLAVGRAPIATFARPPWANLKQGLVVRSMQDDVTGPVKPSLYAIMGGVLLLLVIASVNVANLLLARGAQRRAELAMRVALGAGRGRIVRQLLTESVVLALIGGVAGLGVAALGVRAFLIIAPPGLPRIDAIRVDGRVFLFALALTAVVGVVIGLAPALGAMRAEWGGGLQGVTRARGLQRPTRSALVVAEVALTVVLLVSAGLLYRSVTRLLMVAPGFDPSNVVTMQVVETGHAFDSDTARLQFIQRALDAVRRVPGVASVGLTSQLPLSGDVDGYGYEAQSVPASANGAFGSALRYAVTPGYFAAMRIPLRRGRLIADDDRSGAPEAIVVNASMAKHLFGDRNPIGERVRFGPEMGSERSWDYIVGVVGDVKHYSLAADAPDAFYVASGQWDWVDNVNTVVVRTNGNAAALAPSLKHAVWSIDGNAPIQRVRTMASFVAASSGQRQFALWVIETFAAVAFVLAAVGLYGVISGGVIERIREIGIRTALGAAPSDLVRAIVARSLLLTGIGALIGIAGALAATRVVRSMLFGISALDAPTYGAVIASMAGMAALAAWAPAWRAVRVDPTIALRNE